MASSPEAAKSWATRGETDRPAAIKKRQTRLRIRAPDGLGPRIVHGSSEPAKRRQVIRSLGPIVENQNVAPSSGSPTAHISTPCRRTIYEPSRDLSLSRRTHRCRDARTPRRSSRDTCCRSDGSAPRYAVDREPLRRILRAGITRPRSLRRRAGSCHLGSHGCVRRCIRAG
jgi:hypothetical protein